MTKKIEEKETTEDTPTEDRPEELTPNVEAIVIEEKGEEVGTSDIRKKEVVGSIGVAEFNAMKKTIARLEKKSKMLEQTADKSKLAFYYEQENKDMPSIFRLRTFKVPIPGGRLKEKLIMRWELTANEVYKDPISRSFKERQNIELFFKDNTSKTVPLQDFAERYGTIECEKVGESTDIEGNHFVTLVVTDAESKFKGDKITMNIKYVN